MLIEQLLAEVNKMQKKGWAGIRSAKRTVSVSQWPWTWSSTCLVSLVWEDIKQKNHLQLKMYSCLSIRDGFKSVALMPLVPAPPHPIYIYISYHGPATGSQQETSNRC